MISVPAELRTTDGQGVVPIIRLRPDDVPRLLLTRLLPLMTRLSVRLPLCGRLETGNTEPMLVRTGAA